MTKASDLALCHINYIKKQEPTTMNNPLELQFNILRTVGNLED